MGLMKRLYEWLHPAPEPSPVTSAEETATAEHAIQSALEDLHAAQENAPKVAELVRRADSHVEKNHFSELAWLSFGGTR